MALKFSLLFIYTLLASSSLVLGRTTPAPAPESDDGVEVTLGPGVEPGLPPNFDPGFEILNPKDPKMVAMAKAAVDEHNKESKSNLVYESLFEALATKDAQGTSYELVVLAKHDKDEENDYSVKIQVTESNVVKVISFTQNP